MKSKFRVASLFSGCGGLDLGAIGGFTFMGQSFARNNTSIVFANDIDPDAVNCYNSNPLLTRDVSSTLGDIRSVELDSIPDFDILLAGFPCQPFSNAGNRKGVNDDNGRGTLFEMCEAVLEGKIKKCDKGNTPKAFIFENVRGILSSKYDANISVPDEIKRRMEKLGYVVSVNLVCASNFGVPQNRYRVLISGIRKDIVSEFNLVGEMEKIVRRMKLPSKEYTSPEKLLLGNLLIDLPNDGEQEYWKYSITTQSMVDNIGVCPAGKKALKFFTNPFSMSDMPKEYSEGRSWKNVPPEKLTPRFRKIFDDPKKYHAPKFFRRFAIGEINGTITASAQPENCGITHPFENRRFSVREIARIQSFPDDYTFMNIPLQSRYKVIGNAVPPVLGWVAVRAIVKLLERRK